MAKITAWDEKNEKWVNIPEHWLGHPTLGKGFLKEKPKDKPAEADKPAETAKPKGGK